MKNVRYYFKFNPKQSLRNVLLFTKKEYHTLKKTNDVIIEAYNQISKIPVKDWTAEHKAIFQEETKAKRLEQEIYEKAQKRPENNALVLVLEEAALESRLKLRQLNQKANLCKGNPDGNTEAANPADFKAEYDNLMINAEHSDNSLYNTRGKVLAAEGLEVHNGFVRPDIRQFTINRPITNRIFKQEPKGGF